MITYEGLREVIQRTYPDCDVEIQDGEYVVVSPHDLLSSSVVVRLVGLLDAWVRPRKLGYVFESNGGFEFPDGDKRAPDVSFGGDVRCRCHVVVDLAAEERSTNADPCRGRCLRGEGRPDASADGS